MSRVVQTHRSLYLFAKRLSQRHDDDCDAKPPVIEMDARERKWAAQKLLRPIEDIGGCEHLTMDDWLEVYRQSWELCISDEPQPAIERFEFSARQLKYTTAHARAVWGLSGDDDVTDIAEDDDLHNQLDDDNYSALDHIDWD
jgi:hypothetical protein